MSNPMTTVDQNSLSLDWQGGDGQVCIVGLVRLRAILKNYEANFQPEGIGLLFTCRLLQLAVNFTMASWPSQRNLDKISIKS